MLNLQIAELSAVGSEYTQNLPLGGILGALFLFEFVSLMPMNFKEGGSFTLFHASNYLYHGSIGTINTINSMFLPQTTGFANVYLSFDRASASDSIFSSNLQIQTIGELLYTNEAIWLLVVSLILLLSIVGPIVITQAKNR